MNIDNFHYASSAPIPVTKKRCDMCFAAYEKLIENVTPTITDEMLHDLKDAVEDPIFEFDDCDTMETPLLKEFRERNIIEDNAYVTFILHITEINHRLLKKLDCLQSEVVALHKKLDDKL